MTRDRSSGLALIIGSLGILVTMALHPSPDSLEALVRQKAIAIGTHSLALASIPISFLGFLGLYERLKKDHVLAPAALVTHGFGMTAVMSAAVVSGLVAPIVAERFAQDLNAQQPLQVVLSYNGHLNMAFAMVFMYASSIALVLWGGAIIRSRAIEPFVGWLGCLVGLAALAGVLIGFLDTSVHGFGLFVLGTAAWTVLVGVYLMRSVPQAAS